MTSSPQDIGPGLRWLPHPLSWGCSVTDRGGGFGGHQHDYDEICLVANDASTIRHGGRERPCHPGTVFLFRRGENHGYCNDLHQQPNLWLVHFIADETLYTECPALADPDPERRVWHLSPEQLATWQGLFTRLIGESLRSQADGQAAALSAWLRLLLIQAARWTPITGEASTSITAPAVSITPRGRHETGLATPTTSEPALAELWELLVQHIEAPETDFRAAIARRLPQYDSLRHRFSRVYGHPPRETLIRMKMERAKYLLLESDDTVGLLAERLGYGRLAEFTRAFTRFVGQSPSAFRAQPLHAGASPSSKPA